ncbi:extracellular solute-binding protein [Haloarcula amylovorans]|uniref:extracellular solute-binding protein n=1 Tax=Haloarcula amylovorans TaxID=2562280 RepID=UPI00142F7D45|nr:extracellular solute-binding protein [Halomicroarcula amylolytica]
MSESDGSNSTPGNSGTSDTQSSGNSGTGTIWFSTGSATDTKTSLAEQWQKENNGNLSIQTIPEIEDKVRNAVPAGKGPHSFIWSHDRLGDYNQSGFLVPQGDEIDIDLESTFTKKSIEASKLDGNLLGLPWGAEAVGMIYNKDMVDSPPETMEDMKAIMEEHHDPENGKYGLAYPISSAYRAAMWAHAFGGYYLDTSKDDILGLTNNSTIKGFEYIIDNLLPYMSEDLGGGAQNSVFSSGNAPLCFNGPWSISNFRNSGINVGVTGIPKPSGGSPSPFVGYLLWYFSKRMENNNQDTKAARSFINWWTTETTAPLELSKAAGYTPVLKELKGSDELPETVRGFAKAIEQGTEVPQDPRYAAVDGPTHDAFLKMVRNPDGDFKQFMKTAEEEIRSRWSN